jgi:glutaminase
MTHSRTASLAFTARGLGYRHHQAEGAVEEEAVEVVVHACSLKMYSADLSWRVLALVAVEANC